MSTVRSNDSYTIYNNIRLVQYTDMAIEVRKATAADAEQWNRIVDRSEQSSPFHYYEALQLLEEYSGTELHPLIGFKGQQPVGVLPVFERRMGPLTLALSPPDGLEVFYLGIALANPPELKQRKVERRNRRFVEATVEWIDRSLDPDLTHIRTVDRYTDVRPLKNEGFDVTPYYTYVVDLDRDKEDVLMGFSGDARSNVRDAENTDVDYEISLGDADACQRIIERVGDRLDDLGVQYDLRPAFAHDLYERLPDGVVRPYECYVEGRAVGGILVLELGDTTYGWQGGTKYCGELAINDVLDWHIMRDAMSRGMKRYDLYGANLGRTSDYKSKFGPEAVPNYSAIRRSTRARVLSEVRDQLPIARAREQLSSASMFARFRV